MREDTRRKFEQALWRERMRKVGVAAAIVAAMAAFTVLWSLDASEVKTRIPGEITQVTPIAGVSTQATQQGLNVDVKLANGSTIRVMALKTSEPKVGDHIEVTEHKHGTGRVTYTWK